MSFDYELAYQQVKKYLGKRQDSFNQAIDSEKDLNKKKSFPSEVFFCLCPAKMYWWKRRVDVTNRGKASRYYNENEWGSF